MEGDIERSYLAVAAEVLEEDDFGRLVDKLGNAGLLPEDVLEDDEEDEEEDE